MTPDEALNTEAGLLDKMMTAENTYNAFQEFKGLQPGSVAQWVNGNPAKWKIITKVNGW